MNTRYPETIGLAPSFGFGDRIGLATPGHLAAVREAGAGITPIFAQQSIREMARIGRTPDDVLGDAMTALREHGWSGPHGADADHLKTPEDINRTAEAGFTFFTLDPSSDVDQQADNYSEATVRARVESVRDSVSWIDSYIDKSIDLSTGTVLRFDEQSVLRAAVKYGAAIQTALRLSNHVNIVQTAADRPYEIELSVDETEQPTTLIEHYIIAEQCLQNGMNLVSLAPRFVGQFEKGVDYIGDIEILEASLIDHAAISRRLGPYKLSLHSGSDKVSIYPALARATEGRFHVKTAGTSFLEALRVVAVKEPELFRDVCEFARTRYEVDRASYHVHATLNKIPPPAKIYDDIHLQDIYLERWETVPKGRGFTESGRQILHCTFGSVLSEERLGSAIRQCLRENLSIYTTMLAKHFSHHLKALRVTA